MQVKKRFKLSLCLILALSANLQASSTILDEVSIEEKVENNNTENTGLYTVKEMKSATKLNLSIRDTPQSVTVLSTQKLQDLGVDSYQEMLSKITGVTLNRWDERVNASARGFDIDYYKIDGLPTYSTWNERDLDLSVYDRVEVVRGANGLTTGYGNPAVSINLVRKRANSKELKGSVSLEGGSWNHYGVLADVGSSLNESGSIRGRVVLKHENSDSFMDGYEKENNLFYGVIDSDLTDTTSLSTGFSYQKLNRNGIRWGGLPAFDSNGNRIDFERSRTASEDWTYWDSEVKSVFVDLKQNLFDNSVLNIGYSYDEINANSALLYFSGDVNTSDGSGINYMDWQAVQQRKQHNFDASLNVPYEIGGLFQEFLVGISYNLDKQTKYNGRYPNGYYSTLTNFYDYDLSLPEASSSDTLYIVKPNEIEQKAIYLANRFSLSENLKLIAGLRLSSWEYSSTDTTKETRKFSNEITPYTGVVYDLDKNHSLYASYTSIFKPQDKKNSSGEYLDPIVGNNYEIGAKGEYFDGLLTTSLSLFQVKQDKVATDDPSGVFVPGTTTVASIEANGVESKGFEVDVTGKVSDNLTLDLSVANFEAKESNGNKYNTKASRTTANLFAKYEIHNISFGGGLNYKSKFYTGTGSSKITQDAYTIANAMASYKLNKNLKFQINVNNIFDKKYYEGIGSNSMVYGEPRNFKASLKYTF